MSKRIKLLLSYDGTDYCGWQKQKDHAYAAKAPSIQDTVEKALQKILQHPVSVSASGRTDAGVHAMAQIAHFDTDRPLPKDLTWALRSQLPNSIVAKGAWEVPENFHSTLSATHKTYRYLIWNDARPTALLSRYSWWVRRPLDLIQLKALSEPLVGEFDFASFQSQGTPLPHTVRTLYGVSWSWKTSKLIEFKVTGSGFLKQMVRNLVGTLVDGHLRGVGPEKIQKILEACDRTKAGPTAPPQGLFLQKVYYPKELDRLSLKI